jgi:hypothetical protein
MAIDHEKMADEVAGKFKSKDEGEPETEGGEDEATEPEGEKSDEAGLGHTLAAAVKSGDGEAIYEAVCAIYEHDKGE